MNISQVAIRVAARCSKEQAETLLIKRLSELDESINRTRQNILGLHARKDELTSSQYHEMLAQLVATLKYLMKSYETVETKLRRIFREPQSEFLWEDWSPA